MIVQRDWIRYDCIHPGTWEQDIWVTVKTVWRGWFLLGFIPLFIVMRDRYRVP